MNELAFYFDQIKKYPVLSLDEEKYIVEKMIFYRGKNNKEDKKQYLFWRSKLINHNLRLGVFFAKKISKKFDITLLDAIGYVNEGLCKAADKYELGRGAKFSSYAEWWCIHSLNRQGLLEKDIRFTQKNYYNLTNFKYVLDQLKDEKTGFVTIDDLVKKTRLTRDKIKQYWKDIQYLEPNNVLSINAPYLSNNRFLGNGDIFFIEDTILDNRYFVEKNIGKEETIKYIDEIIARNFCPSDYKIIVGRFGLNGEKIKSLKELSEELEISLESVRLRENIIKRKLKLNPEIIELQYNMERFENVN